MSVQATQINFGEKVIVIACGLLWRFLRLLDPQPIQRYFASKVNVTGHTVTAPVVVDQDDAMAHVCRINNNRMKEGGNFLAKRGDLLKVYNPVNGRFVFRYAQGAGQLRVRFNEIGIDYDAQLELGIVGENGVELHVMPANTADREFYLMYQDKSVSSRQSRALGWYMLIGGTLITTVTTVSGWVGEVFRLII